MGAARKVMDGGKWSFAPKNLLSVSFFPISMEGMV